MTLRLALERRDAITALVHRIESRNLMSSGEAWQLKTACRDLLLEVERLRELDAEDTDDPVQLLLMAAD